MPLFFMSEKKFTSLHMLQVTTKLHMFMKLVVGNVCGWNLYLSLILKEDKMYSSNATDATVNCDEYFQWLIILN